MSDWWTNDRLVSVCVDTPGWFDPFAERLVAAARDAGSHAVFVRSADEVGTGGVAFYLSCMKIVPPRTLDRNHLNVVVHASALPKGRGFSPIAWQVLEGAKVIPVTMIEAAEGADTGAVLMTDSVTLEGHELNDEIRNRLGQTIVSMCLRMLTADQPPVGRQQVGEATWYPRRQAQDSMIDPSRPLSDQFDLLRVVDNDRYPAFFDLRGHRYLLRIEKIPSPGPE
ncbi:MAG: formyltransferase family protein [Tsuneonella sp.]